MRKSITGEFKVHEDWDEYAAYVDGENLVHWIEELLKDRAVSKQDRQFAATDTSYGRIRITVTALDE